MIKKPFLIIPAVLIFVFASAYFIVNGYSVLTDSFEGSKEVIFKQQKVQGELTTMYLAVRERTLILLQMNTVYDAFEMDDLRQKMRDNAEKFLLAREELSRLDVPDNTQWQELDEKLKKLSAKGVVLKNRIADLFVDQKRRQAVDLLLGEIMPIQVDLLSTLESMTRASEDEIKLTIQALNKKFITARKHFQVIGAVLLVIVLFAFIVILYLLVRGEDDLKGLLAHKETQYKVIVDTVKDGIIAMNSRGKISSFNREAEKIFGYQADEIIGRNIHQLIDKSDYQRLESYIEKINNDFALPGAEFTGRRKNNNKIDLHLSLSATGISGEQCLSGIVRDISREKANYNVLLRYREIFSRSDDALAFVDRHHIYKMVNGKYLELFQRSAEDVVDFTVSEVIGETLFYTFEKFHQQCILHDEVVSLNQWVDTPSGYFYLSISYTPYHNDAGDIVGVAIAIRDITEQKKSEDEYFKSSKLESVGVLAGGIAHDFNNLLGGILGNIEMAMRSLDNPEKARKFLQTSHNAGDRAADLTQQLLTFSKGGEPVREDVSVRALLEDTIEFCLHGSSLERSMRCDDGLWHIYADAGQISQVVQNIVINAKQAMPDGGMIKVSCSNVSRHDSEVSGLAHGLSDYVKISIEDNGPGMSNEVLKSIFDPYFTTRENGSGLGLALSYSIINKHEGYIKVDSSEGSGSCFTIYLPASTQAVVETDNEEIIVVKSDNSKRIMVMDDDDMIREIAEAMLEELGYQVVHAVNGEEALLLYQDAMHDEDKKIDLIIMDLTILGGMGGKETIQAIQVIDASVKAIVCSGYSNDPVMANYSEYGFKGAVCKPYNIDELGVAIQQCL